LPKKEALRVQGSIGVLEAAFRRGYLSDLRGAYERLLKHGVYLDRTILNLSLESCKLTGL
jgi:predicted nucleic acid-binding protein